MNKIIKAKRPFVYKNNSNFKLAVFNKWVEMGGNSCKVRPYENLYKSLAFHFELPTIFEKKREARLCFVEGASLLFDTFPDYLCYEIIPIIWDCWPSLWQQMENFFRKHNVKTAFFTSSQTAEHFRMLFPEKNIYHMPEAIDSELYKGGNSLKERKYDYLEFGRCCQVIDSSKLSEDIRVLSSRNEQGALKTREQLIDALADSKITIALTRQDNQPEIAQGIDTLTQRYWECMLSRVILLGRAPKELIDLIGYNPCIQIDFDNINEQIKGILAHIENYQDLVDKNRKVALEMGDWKLRMETVKEWLDSLGYKI